MQTKANIFSPEDIAKIDSIDKDVRMWDYKKQWLKDGLHESKEKADEQSRV